MREKLIELLKENFYDEYDFTAIADDLITNGVTIPVHCKDCKHYELDEGDYLGECHCQRIAMNSSGELYPEQDYFCAYGERK